MVDVKLLCPQRSIPGRADHIVAVCHPSPHKQSGGWWALSAQRQGAGAGSPSRPPRLHCHLQLSSSHSGVLNASLWLTFPSLYSPPTSALPSRRLYLMTTGRLDLGVQRASQIHCLPQLAPLAAPSAGPSCQPSVAGARPLHSALPVTSHVQPITESCRLQLGQVASLVPCFPPYPLTAVHTDTPCESDHAPPPGTPRLTQGKCHSPAVSGLLFPTFTALTPAPNMPSTLLPQGLCTC